jgi:hypothetical protein
MRKTSATAENTETICPACGAAIKAPPSARRRRVQCPKCREVVFIESAAANQAAVDGSSALESVPERRIGDERTRIEQLEARVEALEAALRDSMASLRESMAASRDTVAALRDSVEASKQLAPMPAAAPVPAAVTVARPAAPNSETSTDRMMRWAPPELGQTADFSNDQGRVLFHNLEQVKTQAIEIRTPAGDNYARARAEWFKTIFESAGWTVHGPEEVTLRAAAAGMSLAVPDLPVPKDAAATYFALKAAGFELNQVLDAGLGVGKSPAMALTLPPEKAA